MRLKSSPDIPLIAAIRFVWDGHCKLPQVKQRFYDIRSEISPIRYPEVLLHLLTCSGNSAELKQRFRPGILIAILDGDLVGRAIQVSIGG
jgi:hypothetical protein